MTQDALDRLAALAGIEPLFHDLFGTRRETSPQTKRLLLGAMGLAAETDDAATASLLAFERRSLSRPVDPAFVVAAERQPAAVEIRVPAGATGRLGWTLSLETGAVEEDDVRIESCPPHGLAQLGDEAWMRRRLALPPGLPPGYHRLEVAVEPDDGSPATHAASRLIVAPPRCFDEIAPGCWGVTTQLYALSSSDNWGVGDFDDLACLAAGCAAWGAHAVGVNPLHALYPADPAHCSPYAPSSRAFLNVLYIDVERVPELADCPDARAQIEAPAFRAALAAAREGEMVDYRRVAALKLPMLARLWSHHRARPDGGRARAFAAFRRAGGERLEHQARFDALHEHFLGRDPALWDWHSWPAPFRRPDSAEVAAFAAAHADRVGFFAWLQWLADEQLAAAADAAREAGMSVGLYRDLAVGVHPGGADTWSRPGTFVSGVSVGSPPDMFNPNGQNWGLAPMSPVALRETGYDDFVACLRANMRHAGAVRIDHVMALQRLYWIPQGRGGADGAYVRYPFEDLLRILALESQRQHCLVVGEDLGTVPEGFRPRLNAAGILSCRVLLFEREPDNAFTPPHAYPAGALVSASTHDLPTLAGYWSGNDIAWRVRCGLMDEAAAAAAREERAQERRRLLAALAVAGLLPEGVSPDAPPEALTAELNRALHAFLAATPGRIVMAQLDDMVRIVEQTNLPGTVAEHPNWRRRQPRDLASLLRDPEALAVAAAIRDRRGRTTEPAP
ncbi:MAG: 4-alpha-glucanotransferase [Rhodospirillaceae bacterium]|nr:4-alpha-glucanotransferase [Rhodospirillaceae bacterium]